MTQERLSLGKFGEDLACAFLVRQGYRLLERNYRCRLGEIDVIALHQETVCFVEVKARLSEEEGAPWVTVHAGKQRKLTRLAWWYLKSRGWEERSARFDVVGVWGTAADHPLRIELIANAFEAAA